MTYHSFHQSAWFRYRRLWFAVTQQWESGVVFCKICRPADGSLVGLLICEEISFACFKTKERMTLMGDLLKRAAAKALASKERQIEANDEEIANLAPLVHELLTEKCRDEKRQLDPCTLSIWARGGVWKACLSQKALDLRWFAEAHTIQGLFPALDVAVSRENALETRQPAENDLEPARKPRRRQSGSTGDRNGVASPGEESVQSER